LASNPNNSGVVGQTSTGNAGVLGETLSASGRFGVEGISAGSSYGTVGLSGSGTGVAGQGAIGVSAFGASSTQPALFVSAFGGNGTAGQPMIIARNGVGADVMSLDQAGNMIISGTFTPSGTPLSITRTSSGAKVVTYSPRQSQPTTEDVGEGQLRNGAAYIRLEPSFASTIDREMKYLVFITPQGDAENLYVTNKSSAGFEVRESRYGHHGIAFDYRIVAKPFDTTAARLPLYRHAEAMTRFNEGKIMPAGLKKC